MHWLIVSGKDPQLSCNLSASLFYFSVFFYFYFDTSCLKNIATSCQNIFFLNSGVSDNNSCYAGMDPGEGKWVNFDPLLFLSPLLSFFSYPSNIEIIFDLLIFFFLIFSPPISKSWIRACYVMWYWLCSPVY